MSILDGKIGNRRNIRLDVRLTDEEDKRLDNMVATYNMDRSELTRQRLFRNPIDYARAEISNAIAKAKNGYQRTSQMVKRYFTEPEDAYLSAYAPVGYGLMPAYR